MKILLSIIFMFFSAKSFANELDGKGLDCDVKVTQTLNENTSIGYFEIAKVKSDNPKP